MNTTTALSFGLALLFVAGCGAQGNEDLPAEFEDDREALSNAFSYASDLQELTHLPAGESRAVEPGEGDQVITTLENLVAEAQRVDDEFLEWLDPRMREAFGEYFVRGHELYLKGLEEEDPAVQREGIQMVHERWFEGYWGRNGPQVFERAFPE